MKRLIVVLLGFFICCSPPTITSNRDSNADFSSFKTYCFADYNQNQIVKRPDYDNAESRAIIDAAINNEMAKLGYSKVDSGSDLMVQYDILITEKVDPRVDSAVIYKPWVDVRTDTFNYTEGLLIIRLIDRHKGKMIWQSSLSGILKRKPKSFDNKLDNYIAELFSSLSKQIQ